MRLVQLAWDTEYKKKGEKQDKKNSSLLPTCPIIRNRHLKNVNIDTISLVATYITQSVLEQEASQIKSTQLEKMLFPYDSDKKREDFKRLCCLTMLCLVLVRGCSVRVINKNNNPKMFSRPLWKIQNHV